MATPRPAGYLPAPSPSSCYSQHTVSTSLLTPVTHTVTIDSHTLANMQQERMKTSMPRSFYRSNWHNGSLPKVKCPKNSLPILPEPTVLICWLPPAKWEVSHISTLWLIFSGSNKIEFHTFFSNSLCQYASRNTPWYSNKVTSGVWKMASPIP